MKIQRDLFEYRESKSEQDRVEDIFNLMPVGESVLDVGARDGYISTRLADRFESVTAMDLQAPSIDDERVYCAKGDVTKLSFPADFFDVVLCAEVLEHISPELLGEACSELARVAKRYVLIGVPYQQDIRVACSTCRKCGGVNPPWGHVNSFSEAKLKALFLSMEVVKVSFVGESNEYTNWLSTYLMWAAGNPYGTYSQDEPCVFCGAKLEPPLPMNALQKLGAKCAVWGMKTQSFFYGARANWMHVLFCKR